MPFKANNKMSAKDAFKHRLMYNGYAFSESGEINVNPKSTKNFWSVEHLFYGRIRESSGEISIISPRPETLSSPRRSHSSAPVTVIDFVADAFDDMISNYDKNSLHGKLSKL